MSLTQDVKAAAFELGFDRAGISDAQPLRAAEAAIQERIAQGHMDGLHWFTPERARLATHPMELLPGARTVLALAASYLGQREALAPETGNPRGRIARYAWGSDYHDVLKELARQLVSRIESIAGQAISARIFVDSSPLAERAVAERAGLGWFGKNTMLLLPGAGSWAFLCEVILDLELEPDVPVLKSCGACHRCLDVCPTHALVAAGVLSTPLCISFQTIEQRGSIPRELRSRMGAWVFGCDDCQEVCPVNRKALPARIAALRAYDDESAFPSLIGLLAVDDVAFRARYKGTPVTRAKRWGMQRNACVALGNSGDPAAIPALAEALLNPAQHPIVREHAAWGLSRFPATASRIALTTAWQQLQSDPSPAVDPVRQEITLSLDREP